MTERVRIGTRRSPLAMYQTHAIADALRAHHPALTLEIVQIDTRGDLIRDVPLPQIGGKGLFTQEIEDQLLAGDIDLAVHSLKDLPSALPEGLCYGGSPARGAASDALVTAHGQGLDQLPDGALVATGSVRRRAQLLSLRPDLRFSDLRGNIDTRLRKLQDHGFDAIVMATAALERLGLAHRITERLDLDRVVPAVGQGAMAVELREHDERTHALLAPIFDPSTVAAARAERAFMAQLEGGCSAPLAAHAAQDGPDGSWSFRAWISDPQATRVLHAHVTGPDPMTLALDVAADFLAQGARAIMRG